MNPSLISQIKNCALNLLARREHSQYELRSKLHLRKFDINLIDKIVAELAAQGLQSDQRFVENYIYMRTNKGYGPIRIARELQERGISDEIIAQYLDEKDNLWLEKIATVHQKKFGKKNPKKFSERAKQMRFLQYRGFTLQQIEFLNDQLGRA